MAIHVSAHNLKKAFAARPLFDGLTFAISSGERIGLIGPNGMGKSTLLRILAGREHPDAGTLSLQKGLKIGFLEQVPTFSPGSTVHSAVLEGTDDPDDWENIALAQEYMSRLSLADSTEAPPETPIEQLSGGWKKRVALARELVRKPDLLLLDEPTNHLDVETILWLEEFLARSPFATLTVTHDRLFLQRIASRIIELDRRNPGGLLSVAGDYTTYLELKDQMMAAQEKREVILKNTLRRETEWLRQGAKARTTKQQARIQRAGDLKDVVEEISYRNQVRTARLAFQSAEKNPKRLIDARKISKAYGGRALFKDLDILITPGSRLGLLGANGCGKSTLIRVLLGKESPDSGQVLLSEHLQVAYFEQNRDSLDPKSTVLKTLCPKGEYVDFRGGRVHIRSYLDRFLFSTEQMEMTVGKLSGGEQSRLLIAKLMLQEANVLVLDEPTNDLDMATLTVLEDCLTDFSGAVLLVTHDRYFLDQVATKILSFTTIDGTRSSKVLAFEGLEQWETWYAENEAKEKAATKGRNAPVAPAPSLAKTTPPPTSAKKKKLSFKELRELESMEATIHQAEAELERVTAESSSQEAFRQPGKMTEITASMAKLQKDIERLYARWAELSQE